MSTQIQLTKIKPTYQEIEQALINVVKAGIYYRRPKDGKFMQNYKERIKKLRQAEDPKEFVLKLASLIKINIIKLWMTTNHITEEIQRFLTPSWNYINYTIN
jgi:glycerophosphoryl diester phosphodiesterase